MTILAWLSAEHTAAILAGGDPEAIVAGAGQPARVALKMYRGERIGAGGLAHVIVAEGDATRALDPRRDLRNHSPDGFAYGYSGSGPSQLALAICADALGDDERAARVYQEFKRRFVASLRGDQFEISAADVLQLIASIEAEVRQ